jgi:RNA polymerase sigma-70 factor (ECF subfamily)
MKSTYRSMMNRAFTDAVGAISYHERALLTLFLLDNLDFRQIASAFNVHRTTVIRWLARIQDKLKARIRLIVTQELEIDPDQDSSVKIPTNCEELLHQCLKGNAVRRKRRLIERRLAPRASG